MIPNFNLFGKEISMYMLLALAGVLTTLFFCRYLAERYGTDEIHVLYLTLWAFGGAGIGGHVLFAFTQPVALVQFFTNLHTVSSISDFIFRIQVVFGGSVFYGGLLGALLIGWCYIRKHRLPLSTYADIGAIAIPLFHTFGRIGCFLSGCCFGIQWSHGITYYHSMIEVANRVPRFPVQLAEAFVNLFLFLFLLQLYRHRKLKNHLLTVYLLVYPTCRFLLEFLRGDQYRGFLWKLSTSQWISLALIVTTIGFLLYRIVHSKQKETH